MIFAFFFKSLFLLTGTSIKFKTTFGHFFSCCVLLQIARMLGHWIEVGQTFCGAIMPCIRESPNKYYGYQPFRFNSTHVHVSMAPRTHKESNC